MASTARASEEMASQTADSWVSDPQVLQHVLGVPELSWLIDRIRVRLERGEPVDGTVTLVGATTAQRKAAGRLLGHSPGHGTSLSIPLPEVDAALRRAGIASGLRAAVESLTGPVRDPAAERATEIRRFQDALNGARRSRLAAATWHLAWVDEVTRDGTLTRLVRNGQGELLAQATAVLERLPAGADEPAVLLPALAEAVTGDTRALDSTPLAGLVLRALALREAVPAPAGREAERALWTAAGVVTDDLASQVLVLNVRAVGDGLGEWLTGAAEAEPSVACYRLLQAAVATGTRIHWHSDFDWPGLRTTAAAIRRLGAAPWLMGADDYRGALAASSEPLKGPTAESPWDRRLADLMQASGRAVTEERQLATLLAELADRSGRR
jgi:hypothetical protein